MIARYAGWKADVLAAIAADTQTLRPSQRAALCERVRSAWEGPRPTWHRLTVDVVCHDARVEWELVLAPDAVALRPLTLRLGPCGGML